MSNDFKKRKEKKKKRLANNLWYFGTLRIPNIINGFAKESITTLKKKPTL